MNVTNNNLQSTIVLPTTEAPQFSVVENQVIPLAKARPMPTYPNGTNDHWPDQGLNRLLAKAENFDTNDISEIECLEMLFYLTSKRQDARQLAEAAIETYGSLGRVFDRPGRELRELLGFDYSMTAMLAITKTSMKFILTPKVTARRELGSYAALMDYLALDLRNAEQEIFRIIYLDTKNKIIRDEEMARGTVDAVSIYPKEVAKKAVGFCASSVILAHNHLGDDSTPSHADIQATIKTKGALEFFDINLHDHVIIARKSCFSMQQEKLI